MPTYTDNYSWKDRYTKPETHTVKDAKNAAKMAAMATKSAKQGSPEYYEASDLTSKAAADAGEKARQSAFRSALRGTASNQRQGYDNVHDKLARKKPTHKD